MLILLEYEINMNWLQEAFSLRIKAIHMVTESKTIDVLTNIMKSVLSAKIGERIQVHKTIESVYDIIPRNLFPEEYGGDDKPISQLRGKSLKLHCIFH